MPDTSIKDFEAAIAELESIVKKLQDGDLALEQSLALYERGVQLSRFCHARLEEAERRIEILNERGELKRAPTAIDDGLERFLPRPPACPQVISDAMRYSVFAGGKRLRPTLTLAAADAVARAATVLRGDSPIELALPAACAVEMIHTYSLIHDDLPAMDNDTLRRGRPTLHVVYGDGMAVLAGDGLQAEAFALLAREPPADDGALARRKLRTLGVIAEAAGAVGMVGGQAIDLQAAGQVPGRAAALAATGLRGMHARQTGAIIRASAVSGAIMAGAAEAAVAAIDRFATDIGLAFQIVDDIL